MNEFQEDMADTAERTRSEHHNEQMRQQGGIFVEAVRLTRMPMAVTDATLPGNPITFANEAFVKLSGYTFEELMGQAPHFLNGEGTDPATVLCFESAIAEGRDEDLEILQYRKDGSAFRAMVFASPLQNGQGGVSNHFLSYLDISRRYDAEESLRTLTQDLEQRVAARTAELETANKRLTDLLAEREMLMMEVNHRAKNSLAVAAALLGLQRRRLADPNVKSLFKEAQERLAAMSRVHDLLSRSESSQRIDLAQYIPDLCDALRATAENDGRITLVAKVDGDIHVSADAAFPVGIAVTELVTNAFKYAFPPQRSGEILVGASRSAGGLVEIRVQDNGVGMGDLREGSLGFGLVRALTQQIDGQLDVQNNDGVTVTMTFADGRTRFTGGRTAG